MKRPILLSAIGILLSVSAYSQQTTSMTGTPKEQKINEEVSSLKPADGVPAKFSSQEELNSAVPLKIAKIKELIKSGQYSEERIKVLREELWRFENAIVEKK